MCTSNFHWNWISVAVCVELCCVVVWWNRNSYSVWSPVMEPNNNRNLFDKCPSIIIFFSCAQCAHIRNIYAAHMRIFIIINYLLLFSITCSWINIFDRRERKKWLSVGLPIEVKYNLFGKYKILMKKPNRCRLAARQRPGKSSISEQIPLINHYFDFIEL